MKEIKFGKGGPLSNAWIGNQSSATLPFVDEDILDLVIDVSERGILNDEEEDYDIAPLRLRR